MREVRDARGGVSRSPGPSPPKQGRSRLSYERILRASEALLDGRDWEAIAVSEICAAAKVSASSFYSRFETKEALLFELHARHRERRLAQIQQCASAVDWAALPPRDVVREALRFYVDDRRRVEPFLRSMMLAEVRDPAISAARARLDRDAMRLITDHLIERIGADVAGLGRRLEFAMRVVCAGAQAALAPPQCFATGMQMSDEELVGELTGLFCAYAKIP